MKRVLPARIFKIAVLSTFLLFGSKTAWADHGAGVPIAQYAPRNQDETEIVRLIRTVGQGWERKDIDLVMSAYGPDALQRAWNNPTAMIDYAGIRAEALGAFRDPKVGQIRFVEINQKFHGWGGDHYYRDFWMFARRGGRWSLVRYDYEPQPPFDRR